LCSPARSITNERLTKFTAQDHRRRQTSGHHVLWRRFCLASLVLWTLACAVQPDLSLGSLGQQCFSPYRIETITCETTLLANNSQRRLRDPEISRVLPLPDVENRNPQSCAPLAGPANAWAATLGTWLPIHSAVDGPAIRFTEPIWMPATLISAGLHQCGLITPASLCASPHNPAV